MYSRLGYYTLSRTRRQVILGASAALLPILAGCGDPGALDGLAAGETGRVSAVPGGDRIELDGGETVDLAGVEAPGPPYATESQAALARLVEGKGVQLMYGGAHASPYGRTVAQLRTVDGRAWVQGALLEQGAVRVRTFADNRALAKIMLAREAGARAARRGLWAYDQFRVRLPNEVEAGETGLMIVEGRVQQAGRFGDGSIYLDFDKDWRKNVSAVIPRSALRDFRSAGVDPIDLQGRLIRIRARKSYGLRLTLDHPEQLERLRS
jgi:micrococcal nuclease